MVTNSFACLPSSLKYRSSYSVDSRRRSPRTLIFLLFFLCNYHFFLCFYSWTKSCPLGSFVWKSLESASRYYSLLNRAMSNSLKEKGCRNSASAIARNFLGQYEGPPSLKVVFSTNFYSLCFAMTLACLTSRSRSLVKRRAMALNHLSPWSAQSFA